MNRLEALNDYIDHLVKQAEEQVELEEQGLEAQNLDFLYQHTNTISDRLHKVYGPLSRALQLRRERRWRERAERDLS